MNRPDVAGLLGGTFAAADGAQGSSAGRVECYWQIAHRVLRDCSEGGGKPRVLGICGPQGSGKSTMAAVIELILRNLAGLSVASLSLDDFYLSRQERALLASAVHPLLQTRGVPGTHDIALANEVMRQLTSARPDAKTCVPRFDKAFDEGRPHAQWPVVDGRPDVVILEGWCVGALPQSAAALATPINDLERSADSEGRWRRYVNEQLGRSYQDLFAWVDLTILLRAPRYERIVSWRQQQEHGLAAQMACDIMDQDRLQVMSDDEIRHFVMYFERITRHIEAQMPSRADMVIDLGEDREIVAFAMRVASGCYARLWPLALTVDPVSAALE